MFAAGQTLVRLRAPLAFDAYSAQATALDWPHAVETSIAGFGLDPGISAEASTVSREQITTRPTLYWLGSDAPDVVASDRMRDASGSVWEVVGNRADWCNPLTGWVGGSSWPLERVEG